MVSFRFEKYAIAILLLLLCERSVLFAQLSPADFAKMTDFMPPPPNANSLIQNSMASVNKNTGAPNVNIPIYGIKGHKLATEISLSYNSTGIKVDEVSGRTGMGWSLNAGGVITRTLRGSPDESNTRLVETAPISQNCGTWALMNRAEGYDPSGGYDGQPDLFNFSMNGLSGSFVFDEFMVPVPIQPQQFKIDKNFSGSDWNFKITANDGIRYYFGGTGATEKTKRPSSCARDYNGYLANAWYLTKIEHPNGEKIDFLYTLDENPYLYDNGFSESMSWAEGNNPPCQPNTPPKCANFNQTKGVVLSSISNDFTKIDLSYISRLDCTDMLLFEVKIFDKKDIATVAGKYVFNYTQVTSTGPSSYENSIWGTVRPAITPYLTSLQDLSKGSEFSRAYNFEYITPELRSRRLSFAQDHWGYYNGKNNLSFVPRPDDLPTRDKFPAATADRSVDETKAEMGLLKKITFPTGGLQEIEYEGNKFYDLSTMTNKPASGLRVKKIKTQNPGESAMIKKYIYAEYETQNISSLHSSLQPQYIKNYETRYVYAPATEGNPNIYAYCETIGMYSNSLSNLYSYQNSPVSYSSVMETNGADGEGGMTQARFMVASDYPGWVAFGDYIPGQPLSNASAAFNGKLKEEIVFKKGPSSFFPVKRTVNLYHQDTRLGRSVFGYVANRKREHIDDFYTICGSNPLQYQDETSDFNLNRYNVWSYWTYLKTSTETQYDEDGLNPVTKTTTYSYEDESHLQVTKIETSDGDGRLLTTSLKYPKDYLVPGTPNVYDDMIAENIITPVINYKQTKTGSLTPITEVATTYFEPTSNNFVPAAINKSTQGGTLLNEGTFNSYDNKGNLLQYTDKAGIVHAIIWGYNSLYPVAKISNASYTSAIATLTGGSITALQTMDGEALITELHKIRTGLPNAYVTTYTYKHLAGVTTITDPNNKRSTYLYDSFNRLVLVRDQDGNIVKRICYNYQGQVENCNIPACDYTAPVWQNTATAQRCGVTGCAYTGYMQQEQLDINTCSPTYNQKKWNDTNTPATCTGSPTPITSSFLYSGYTIVFTNTSTGASYSFDIPVGNSNPLCCLPPAYYDIHIYRSAGTPISTYFTVGINTLSGTEATFYNLRVNNLYNNYVYTGLAP